MQYHIYSSQFKPQIFLSDLWQTQNRKIKLNSSNKTSLFWVCLSQFSFFILKRVIATFHVQINFFLATVSLYLTIQTFLLVYIWNSVYISQFGGKTNLNWDMKSEVWDKTLHLVCQGVNTPPYVTNMFDFGLPLNSGNIINKGPDLNSAHLYLSITVHIIKSPIYRQSTISLSRSSGDPVLTQQYEFDSYFCHFLITFNKVAKWANIIIKEM